MNTAADHIVAVVAHARDVRAAERQRFGETVRARPSAGGLLLETCHRIELYLPVVDDRSPAADALPAGARVLRGGEAVRHALAVAAGRDSVVVGEDQVLHQLRQALVQARASGKLDPVLERLFATALRTGRLARSWRLGGSPSLADLAIGRIERNAPLSGHDLLIVGAGTMGRLAARAGLAAGAHVSVTSRSADRAAGLAGAVGATIEELDPGARAGRFAGVIVALAGPWRIGPVAIEALAVGSTVVDLSVPPAVPDRLATLLGNRLTTADDLARLDVRLDVGAGRAIARLDALVNATTEEFLAWLEGRERRAAAQALVERADHEREAELAQLWRRLPDLDAEARATIEGMSRHLARRILREPLARLGADADGRHERAVRELWTL